MAIHPQSMVSPADSMSAGEIRTYQTSEGEKKYICAYWDASDPATMSAGSIVAVSYDTGDTKRSPLVIAPATLAVYRYMAVSLAAITAAGWYWFQIKGVADALCDGTTDIGIGDYLEILNSGTAFVQDHATARSVNSVAVSRVAYTTNSAALKEVWLIGDRVITAGS